MYRKICCLLAVIATLLCLCAAVHATEENAGYMQLSDDMDGLAIEQDMLLDLNGHHVTNATVAQGVTLRLMDSANDEYDAEQCGSFSGTVNGTVEQVVKHDAKNYLVIEQEGVYSAHRFYAGIDRISLVPDAAALGYKAVFKADTVINAMVESYGYRLWVNDNSAKTFTKNGAIEKDELTLRVKNILDTSNETLSQLGATATIYGQATITFRVNGEAVVVDGAEHATTLRQAVEAVNATLGRNSNAYSETQIQSVRDLLNKFESYTNAWEQEYIFTEDKFEAVENVSVTYGDALTLGQVFTAVEGVTIGEKVTVTVNGAEIAVADNWADTVLALNAGKAVITITDNDRCWTATNTVEVAKADPSYELPTGLTATYGDTLADVALPESFTWVDSTASVGNAGTQTHTAIYNAGENYNTVEVTVSILVTRENEDKFAVALYDGEPAFLYRVGNSDAVKLGSLFKAVEGAQIGNVTVTVSALDGAAVSAVYTANSADWTAATLKFTGTGPVAVTIVDDAYCNSLTMNLEVVTGYNVTAYSQLKNRSSVLLSDIIMPDGSTYALSNASFYGNGFTVNAANAAYAATQNGYANESYVIFAQNVTMDNVQIIGAVYTAYGATPKEDYNRALVLVSGNSTIVNSYLSNTASPIRVSGGTLEVINTTLQGGNYANLDIRNGNVVLDNVTTINQVKDNDLATDGTVVVGLGVVFHHEQVLETTTLIIRNGFTQYNFISESQGDTYIADDKAKKLVSAMFNSKYADVQFVDSDGDTWVNTGIIAMTDTIDGDNISDIDGYQEMPASVLGSGGFVSTVQPDQNGLDMQVPNYVTTGQYAISPVCSFDYTGKNYVAKTEGSNDYCYYSTGVVMLSMDEGDSFAWDTSILTATKNGQTLPYTVTMDGTDYSGQSITFNAEGEYTVAYNYTDSNNYCLDADGNVINYEKTYTKTVHISVAVVKPDAKHAEFTFGSNGIASKMVTVGNSTYVMPDVTATSSTIGSKTVSGATIYYPIVEAYTSDGKYEHGKLNSWYMCFPVFKDAVSITDYADGGTGDAVTYNSATTTMPAGLTAVNPTTTFQYAATATAPETHAVHNNVLIYKSPTLSNNARNEMMVVAQYTYQDNAGTTYNYYVGYHCKQVTVDDGCVTGDTLVTMADGSQKQIKDVTYSDQLLVWDFYKGEYAAVPSAIIFDHGYGNNTVIKLSFSDGTSVNVVNMHQFMDATENRFVTVDAQTVSQYVGHEFVKQDGSGYTTVALTEYAVSQEYVEAYGIISAGHYNILVNGMFSTDFMYADIDLFNYFTIGENMMYDSEAMEADIAAYGLYSYEDFADVLTYEQFTGFNVQYFKIPVGKGLYTYEGILNLIETYLKA